MLPKDESKTVTLYATTMSWCSGVYTEVLTQFTWSNTEVALLFYATQCEHQKPELFQDKIVHSLHQMADREAEALPKCYQNLAKIQSQYLREEFTPPRTFKIFKKEHIKNQVYKKLIMI